MMTFNEYGTIIAEQYFLYEVMPIPINHSLKVKTYVEKDGKKILIDERNIPYRIMYMDEKNSTKEYLKKYLEEKCTNDEVQRTEDRG